MKIPKNTFLLMLLINIGLFAFAGGNGSSGDPYQVSNPAELDSVRHYLSSYFIQTRDIDLGSAPWNLGAGWLPIGDTGTPFTGSYNGNNYTISNLFIDRSTDLVGLFGYLVGGSVHGLNLTNFDIHGGTFTGGLAGYSFNNSSITNCTAEGDAGGVSEIGGIAGYIELSIISNCTFTGSTSASYQSVGGLVGTSETSQIINCSSNSNVVSSGDYAGGLIGFNIDTSSVSLSDFTGTVSGVYYVGGLIGYSSNTTINECNANSNIDGSRRSSVLIGGSQNDSISNCYSSGIINGDECGGIVGEAIGSTVTNCKTDVTINGKGWGLSGGLIGRCDASVVSNCFSSGSVYDDWVVGGLIGSAHNQSTISNSYSNAEVSCSIWSVGGFIGESYDSDINNCYSIGAVNGPDYYGGFCGYLENSTFTSCYWDKQTSGQTTSDGGTGKTTVEMKQQATYSGWDFVTTPIWKNVETLLYPYLAWQPNSTISFVIDPVEAGTINGIDGDYPVGYGIDLLVQLNEDYDLLNWSDNTKAILSTDTAFTYVVTDISTEITANCMYNPFAGGMGTESDPFQVSNADELNKVREFLDYYFIQTADIDLGVSPWTDGDGWVPIAVQQLDPFTGNYNGNGFKIQNLTINDNAYPGLFSYTDGASFTDVILENVDLTGGWEQGALIADCKNSILFGCSSSGTVNGASTVGGLVGVTFSSQFTECYSTCTINGTEYTGGFAGAALEGTVINDCYASGPVTGTNYSGGFISYLENSTVTNSYSSGAVSGSTNVGGLLGYSTGLTLSDCFWDTDTSGQLISAGGTGKTTSEMKLQATYTNWDYSTPIWSIHESLNNGYPYLEWEDRIPVGIPSNVTFVNNGSDLTITWDPVTGATGYKVYSSVDPYGTFNLDLTGVFNGEEWTTPTPGANKMFYYVVAINPTKK
ncbi:MAG: hypothetical protein JXR69_09410 [Candidatus Delongbacteria bacterium]|nr:hypothetical protein [Candidatus Delongbacteria bacterium]